MDSRRASFDDQAALWNGPAARAWVEEQSLIDQVLRPLEALLTHAAAATEARRVLDVGCGTGSTTFALARVLGPSAECVGIDISDPMIAAARARAERDGAPAVFVRDDAQTHAFDPASFDMIISRLGVMFFSDPVAAFANLRNAARKGAELRFLAWRSAEDNPFMTTAERAAASLLPVPAREPDAPGQFAFADSRRVRAILDQGGWGAIEVRPVDVACTFPEAGLNRYVSRFGPVGLLLRDADETLRDRVVEAVRPAFEPFVHGAEVRFTAACWMVSARR